MRGNRILLVEDDSTYADALRSRLEADAFEVRSAASAEQGVNLLRAGVPDVLVLSLDLPHGSGLKMHEHLRDAGEASMPVIYLAADTAGRDAVRARSLGAVEVLERPIAPSRVADLARRLCTPTTGTTPRGRAAMRILVIEGDRRQRRLIEKCLMVPGRETIDITFGSTVAQACELIQRSRYDCVILDHHLVDGAGHDILEESEEHLLTTPVIGLAEDASSEVILEYVRAGCADFLLKGDVFRADVLRRRIAATMSRFQRRAMATIIDRRQLGDAIVESQERLISLARVDHLMGICNRAVFDDFHPSFHEEVTQRGGSYAVGMIDVDCFKDYNDGFGHAAGDEVLRRVATAIAASLRENDFVARYGGEEIVVLLDEVDRAEAMRVGERLRQSIYDENIPHAGSRPHGRVTVSIGLSIFDAPDFAPARLLLLRADEALYRAKESGRNCVQIAGHAPIAVP